MKRMLDAPHDHGIAPKRRVNPVGVGHLRRVHFNRQGRAVLDSRPQGIGYRSSLMS